MRHRIQTLDGLRFLAALGVLWIHTWTTYGNPRLVLWKFDLTNVLAIGANGVDLFFVISGFCMYYFYGSRQEFSYHDFYRFLCKRWVRLSPAFYLVTLLYILFGIYYYHYNINWEMNMLHSIFYLNWILPAYATAPHFWTLTVEWQFYFTIPFLLIYQRKFGFKKAFLCIFGGLFLVACCAALFSRTHLGGLTDTFVFRGVEFSCGIAAAKLLLKNTGFFIRRKLWLTAFICLTYTGRLIISQRMLDLSHNFYALFKLTGFTLMAAGFAGVLYLAVTSKGLLNTFLGNKLFKMMGRISYSFYLLHVLIYPLTTVFIHRYLPSLTGITTPMISTLMSTAILLPAALIWYNLLEKPFLSFGNLTRK